MKKKKIIITLCTVVVLAITGAFIYATNGGGDAFSASLNSTQIDSEGKKCNGTVGCDCTGFKPKTDGDVWEEAYCKKCGHHKRYHK